MNDARNESFTRFAYLLTCLRSPPSEFVQSILTPVSSLWEVFLKDSSMTRDMRIIHFQ